MGEYMVPYRLHTWLTSPQKAYCSKNFNTLVAILAGLDSHCVKRALQQAGVKPGIWESRMLRDLQQWSTSDDDFRHIRQTVEALSEAKSVVAASQESSASGGDPQANNSARSRAASELRPPQPPPACVPFFGAFYVRSISLCAFD